MTADTENPLPHLEPKKASSVLIMNEEGLVLGVSRKNDATIFGLVGGKTDPGESYVDAAIRETFEETGVTVLELEQVYEDYCGDSTRGDVIYYCVTFKATKWIGEPYSKEAGVVAWITPQKLFEGCFGEYNKKLFAAIGE